MANSVQKDAKSGPDWPLGLIVVATPGTPVGVMSLVDPNSFNAPETISIAEPPGQAQGDEYTSVFQQLIFQGFKSNAGTGLTPNTGNIYIVRKPSAGGSGGHTDFGTMVAVIAPGQTFVLASGARNRDTFSGYRYFVDADTAGDSCLVTGIVQ